MSKNTALITDAAQTQAQADLDTYAAGVAAHIGGDWGQHRQMAHYKQNYTSGAGTISGHVIRMLLTDGSDVAVICPAFLVGPIPSTGLPVIAVQPLSQTIPNGEPYQLNVYAASDLHMSYQWQLNGVNIPNAVSSVYSVPAAATPQDGSGLNYRCAVTNQRGTTYSNEATITVV